MANERINTNGYTIIYAVIMTVIVALLLALLSTGLKPIQQKEIALDKKMAILNSVNPLEDKSQVEAEYEKRIKEVVINPKGDELKEVEAFDLIMKKELRKEANDRQLPLYIYTNDDGSKKYIMPLHGSGLWDEIWGYVALNEDLETIAGAVYDHKGETPGLGGEISQAWFEDQFEGKRLLNDSGEFIFVVNRGKKADIDSRPQEVDGISGATITGDGVWAMLEKGYANYAAYFKKLQKQKQNAMP